MVAINFERRFAEAVASGKKLQTIRRERKRNIIPGDKLQLYTGMRHSSCRKLADAVCTQIQAVKIGHDKLFVDGLVQNAHDRERFAVADGFESYFAMAAWFSQKYMLPFSGRVIKWRLAE